MDENRQRHSFAVAERMKEYTEKYSYFGKYLDSNDMYLLGLVHDIGREVGINQADHEHIGAEFLNKQAIVNDKYTDYKYAEAVENHGNPEYVFISEADAKSIEQLSVNRATQLLQYIDMTTNYDGGVVTIDERCQSVGVRHGIDSSSYKTCIELNEHLKVLEEKFKQA